MNRFFHDKQGKVVIAQKPNLPIITSAVCVVLARLPFPSYITEIASLLSFGAIFTWAWLEIFQGVNIFRRLLGAIVLIGVLYRRVMST